MPWFIECASRLVMLPPVSSLKASLRRIRLIRRSVMTYIRTRTLANLSIYGTGAISWVLLFPRRVRFLRELRRQKQRGHKVDGRRQRCQSIGRELSQVTITRRRQGRGRQRNIKPHNAYGPAVRVGRGAVSGIPRTSRIAFLASCCRIPANVPGNCAWDTYPRRQWSGFFLFFFLSSPCPSPLSHTGIPLSSLSGVEIGGARIPRYPTSKQKREERVPQET
ncbi:uncharacterized protein LY79DRAFT_548739 [Colletotrichum navitas]|uniref:Uncharacterized protein n=1 Tax=Colletotrichum navitas TaxID=681940 RepID=A0AAD8Q3K6_9PEZI|nr:uncharacterized protein LY79DRAFT_548739 [Colletotrichum navitas]KAK1594883.1 hypothetical protein LY79DRAFT_548739 [Colletotrichum navitas]